MTTTPTPLGEAKEPPNAPQRLVHAAVSSLKRQREPTDASPSAGLLHQLNGTNPYPGKWNICDFRRSLDAPGLTVVLRRRSTTGLGHTLAVYVTAEHQAGAGQPAEDLCEGDEVEVRVLGPNEYAVVKQG